MDVDVDETDELGATHFMHGCIAFRTECREVMLDMDVAEVNVLGMYEKYSAEDVKFMDIMSQRMYQRDDGYYEAPLLLYDEAPLPLNKSKAQKCLELKI